MNETWYNIYPKVHYGTEQRRACRSAKALVIYTCQSTDHMYVSAHVIEAS